MSRLMLADVSCAAIEVGVGDVLHLHDHITGFSKKDVYRWCIVTAVVGQNVRVGGRSTTRQDGVSVPADAMPEFDADGWVPSPALRISLAEARAARNVGRLDNHLLQQVLFYLNEDIP